MYQGSMQKQKLCHDIRQLAEKRRHAPEGAQSCTKKQNQRYVHCNWRGWEHRTTGRAEPKKQKVAIKMMSKIFKLIALYIALRANAKFSGGCSPLMTSTSCTSSRSTFASDSTYHLSIYTLRQTSQKACSMFSKFEPIDWGFRPSLILDLLLSPSLPKIDLFTSQPQPASPGSP